MGRNFFQFGSWAVVLGSLGSWAVVLGGLDQVPWFWTVCIKGNGFGQSVSGTVDLGSLCHAQLFEQSV